MSISGIFNINKPAGKTSFDVVAAVRRLTGERRVGHAGTLDPLAVGVLPVCVGQATKVVEYLTGSGKTYCAAIELGKSTDTDDAEGRIIAQTDASSIGRGQLEQVLYGFIGKIEQIPPMYSAIKIGGRKLYELARRGTEIEVAPRQIEIYGIRLIGFEPPVVVMEVECSKGTYIRSLARDIGAKLGVGAYLAYLVRTKSGIFELEDAVSLDGLSLAFEFDYWRSIIYPVDEALLRWNSIIVGPEREQAIRDGRPIPVGDWMKKSDGSKLTAVDSLPPEVPADKCRAYGFEGKLLAVLDLDTSAELWRPHKVFSLED